MKMDSFAIMGKTAPGLCADLPFLPEIPESRVLGEAGDLFWIVALDVNAAVAVSKGVWELAWTEVEGDRKEVEPGAEYISIFLNDQNSMRITLEDRVSSQESFYNKELAVFEETMYPGCGNDLWTAYVGYTGKWDTIYSVTLMRDDTLLMKMYWEMEGMPMVAHKRYRRME